MATAAPAPQAKYRKLLPVTYIYAAALAGLAVVYLMGMGGFDFASIAYITPGSPVAAVAVAATLIFALPFLLRFALSPLARLCSALLTLLAPFFVLGHVLYVSLQYGAQLLWYDIVGSLVLAVLGATSFIILGGSRALKR